MRITLVLAVSLFILAPHRADAAVIIQRPLYIGLTSGLVGYWSFDGADMNATKAVDRSGNGNDGTLTNGPARVAGKLGQALSYDGGNDTVTVSAVDLSGTNKVTLSFWLYKTRFNPASGETQLELTTNLNSFATGLGFFINPGAPCGSTDVSPLLQGDVNYNYACYTSPSTTSASLPTACLPVGRAGRYNRALSADEIKRLYNVGR